MPDKPIDWTKPLRRKDTKELAGAIGPYVDDPNLHWAQITEGPACIGYLFDGWGRSMDCGIQLENVPEKKVFEKWLEITPLGVVRSISDSIATARRVTDVKGDATILHVRIEYEPGVHQLGDE